MSVINTMPLALDAALKRVRALEAGLRQAITELDAVERALADSGYPHVASLVHEAIARHTELLG